MLSWAMIHLDPQAQHSDMGLMYRPVCSKGPLRHLKGLQSRLKEEALRVRDQ